MDPHGFYQQQSATLLALSKRIRTKRNLITFMKLLTFGLMVFLVYRFIDGSDQPLLYWGILSVLFFGALTFWDSRTLYRQRFTEELLRINQLETDALNGKYTDGAQGDEFLDPGHPYANDLDLFGENSLFQQLNRTVTASGTRQLADWLLHLCQDPETIRQRQQATAELASLPEWCQHFRACGALHPTQHLDAEILKKWRSGSPFFKKPQTVRPVLWSLNSLVILSWTATFFTPIPASLPLCLSLLQLLILSCWLKKINRYHQQLNLFLKTVSHYRPLVELLHRQTFQSDYLKQITDRLFAPPNHSLQALKALYKIQNRLDQRGNILVAFVLNGLYLKDFHTLLCLDRWKRNYGARIEGWTQVLSKTDALISMANYRFNHPSYSIPVISNDSLIEAREIGHPLLKSERSVTNDFRIKSLHQVAIVTGANMAGKSTFLRTIGVNLVLAQSGNVVCSRYLAFQPMTLFTSMRTTDNLSKDTSYFHAELIRLQQLVTLATKERRVFMIIDEMLKGTNSVDKLNGSLAFLKKLLTLPISGLVATHDLALGELAAEYPEHFFNVCFEIIHTGQEISYDYKLHPGVSRNMNASILLKQMGLI